MTGGDEGVKKRRGIYTQYGLVLPAHPQHQMPEDRKMIG